MKTCIASNCVSPVFSHLYCQRHQYLRTDKKLKKLESHPQKNKARDFSFGFTGEYDLFWHLWENSQGLKGTIICPFTGKTLQKYSSYFLNHFAHILNKKNYPYFKLNPDNIRIVSPEFHRIIDQGTLKERAEHPDWKWEEWDALVITMKEVYAKFKKDNLLA